MALTDEDREALAEVLSVVAGDFTRYSPDAHPDHNRWSWRGDGHGSSMREDVYRSVAQLAPQVEAIVARHVAAALNEAADTIDGWREMAVWAAGNTEDPDQAQNSVIRSRAYHRAARIVRAAANP